MARTCVAPLPDRLQGQHVPTCEALQRGGTGVMIVAARGRDHSARDSRQGAAMRLIRAGVRALAAVLRIAPAWAEHVVRWVTPLPPANLDPHAAVSAQTL